MSSHRNEAEKRINSRRPTPEQEVVIDLNGKMNGRGAYLSKDAAVIATAKKKRTLDHHLKVKTTDALYDELLEIAGGTNE